MPSVSLTFADLGLNPAVLDAVRACGYINPTPVQQTCIPALLEGSDLLGLAPTGSGKTAAFALPLLSRINLQQASPQVLVLAPTRELALQVSAAFELYGRGLTGLGVATLYGGQPIGPQRKSLSAGAQVVIGTPGRILDHLERGSLRLADLQCAVLDEADEMLRMGFIDDVEAILAQSPKQRQTVLFSATLPAPIRRIAHRHLHDPIEVRIAAEAENAPTIEQRAYIVPDYAKREALFRLLETEDRDGVLVFTATRSGSEELANELRTHGHTCAALNGDMDQKERERTIGQLKNGEIDILVATDVAARGIDVTRLTHVINLDAPHDPQVYTHRIGRTGRAGRSGIALLFLTPRERYYLRGLEKTLGKPIAVQELPTEAEVAAARSERFRARLAEALNAEELEFFNARVGDFAQALAVEPAQLAAALLMISQDQQPVQYRSSVNIKPVVAVRREPKFRRERPDRPDRSEQRADATTYRIAVGKRDGATAREIVGAIANEVGLRGQQIGPIRIRDDHSLVGLPSGLPKAVRRTLKTVRVRGNKLNAEPVAQRA
ncbi:MAG: DEAD/DEAH box helicase [Gammaproteobacteria bacterium]